MKPEIDSFVRRKIIELVDQGKIKTVHVDGIQVNKQNLAEHRLKILYKDLQLSRKYLELFIQDNVVDHVYRRYIKDPKEYIVIVGTNKIIDFDLSKHAVKQFVRRLIVATQDSYISFAINYNITKAFNDNIDQWIEICEKHDYNNPLVIDAMIDFLKQSTVLQPKSISRDRDKREFEKRDQKHEGVTNRLVSHPFAFVINDGVLKTVELFSSTADVRTANAVTSNNGRWWSWFSNFQTTMQRRQVVEIS